MQQRATHVLAELKQQLVKVLADCELTIIDRATDQWRK